MLELGVGADIVRGVGVILWGILAIALLVALIKPKTIIWKALSTLLVLAVFFGPMVPGALRSYEQKQRYKKAKALFDERCKTAGEKIYRTVEGVEGVLIAKRRPERNQSTDQFELNDPYGEDATGDAFAGTMLWGRDEQGHVLANVNVQFGYKYVVIKNVDSTFSQFVLSKAVTPEFPERMQKVDLKKPLPRYAVSYEDISTTLDRQNWVAGSKLSIVDLTTNEVLGERIGWMFDRGLGDRTGERSPWRFAAYNACPKFPLLHGQYPMQVGQARNFTEKVLKPLKESK